jgi:hypothetical protein
MLRLAGMVLAACLASGSALADPPPLWQQHRYLSADTPMVAVNDRETIDAQTTRAFFQRLTDQGFECRVTDHPQRRIRRVEVTCARDVTRFVYAGGFPPGYSMLIIGRITAADTLLGGRRLAEHIGDVFRPLTQASASPR